MATDNFDYCLVDKDLQENFTCKLCTKVLKDPHLTGCCGQHFCESCLENCCPHCQAEGEDSEEFQHFLDEKLKCKIYSLRVHCTNKEEGCQWIGELGSLKDHLETANGCDYVEVKCPNKCQRQMFKRKYLRSHLENICPEFPLECPNKCGRDNIKRKDMKNHRSQCSEEPVQCPFEEAGCKEKLVRRELEQHMSATQQHHQEMIKELKMEIARLVQHNTELKETNDKIRATLNKEITKLQQEKSVNSFQLKQKNLRLQRKANVIEQELMAAEQVISGLHRENSRLAERDSTLEQDLELSSNTQNQHLNTNNSRATVVVTAVSLALFSLGVAFFLKNVR